MFKDPRPWHRARLRFIVPLAIGVFAAGYPLYWALTARPEPRIDYTGEIVALSAGAQPRGANGWPILVDLVTIARRPAPVPHIDHLNFNAVWLLEPAAGIVASLLAGIDWLDEQDAFVRLHELAGYPNVVAPAAVTRDAVRFGTTTQTLGTVVRARAASIYVALARHDQPGAVGALEDCLAGVRALSYQPNGIAATSTMRALTAVCHNLEAALADFDLDRGTLHRLLDALQSLDLAPPDFAVAGERLSFLDMVQRCYSDDGDGDGRLLPAYTRGTLERPANRLHNLGTIRHAHRKAVVDVAEAYYELAFAFARMGLTERRQQRLFTMPFADTLGPDYVVLINALPYWADFAIAERDQLLCKIARLQIMAAIELYALDNGDYPPDLSAVVPGVLPALPHDLCFDLDRLRYARHTGLDGRSGAYVLYDAGPDGVAQQGTGDDTLYNRPTGAVAVSLRQAVAAVP